MRKPFRRECVVYGAQYQLAQQSSDRVLARDAIARETINDLKG